jgi:hypothetical protein
VRRPENGSAKEHRPPIDGRPCNNSCPDNYRFGESQNSGLQTPAKRKTFMPGMLGSGDAFAAGCQLRCWGSLDLRHHRSGIEIRPAVCRDLCSFGAPGIGIETGHSIAERRSRSVSGHARGEVTAESTASRTGDTSKAIPGSVVRSCTRSRGFVNSGFPGCGTVAGVLSRCIC